MRSGFREQNFLPGCRTVTLSGSDTGYAIADAVRVVETAKRTGRKLVVGYILRHHPSWMRLIEEARGLGGPYVFRLNLNQQSSGHAWETHKALMQTTSPIVDCGVHYVDVMCQMTRSPFLTPLDLSTFANLQTSRCSSP